MPLQWQKIEVPMGFGIDEKAHRFISAPPGLAQLLNGRWDKDGSVNFRPGWANGASLAAQKLLAFRDKLYAVSSDPNALTNNNEFILSALNTDTARFDVQGGEAMVNSLSECTIDGRETIARANFKDFNRPDLKIYETGKLAIIAWQGYAVVFGGANVPQRIFAVVIDTETLAVVTPVQEISTSPASGIACVGTRIVVQGTTAYVIYVDTSAGNIRAKPYNLSTRAWGTDTLLFNNAFTSGVFDAYEGDSTFWVLAYKNATPAISVRTMNGTAVINSLVINETPTAIAVACDATLTGQNVWLLWGRLATDVRHAVYDLALTVKSAAATAEVTALVPVRTAIVALSNSQAVMVYTLQASAANAHPTTRFFTLTSAGVAGNFMSRYSLSLESRPWIEGAHVYATLGYRAYEQQQASILSRASFFTVALCGTGDASSPDEKGTYRSCAMWAYSVASIESAGTAATQGITVPQCLLKSPSDLALEKYWFPAAVVSKIKSGKTNADGTPELIQEAGIDLCRFDLGNEDHSRSVEFGRHLFFAGGQTNVFDGQRIMEHGYFYPPEDCVGTVGGGGALTAGVYQVALVWETRLASGAVLRSEPVLVTDGAGSTQFTVVLNDQISLVLPPLNLTQKYNATLNTTNAEYFQAPVAVIYRTEANGSVFYREPDNALTVNVMINGVFRSGLANHMLAAVSVADATAKAGEQLYTNGSVPSWPMPPCDDFVVYKNRLFGIKSEDKKAIPFTQVLIDGEVPGWHPFLEFRIDDDGPAVGLATMDDNLIVFKADSIYIVRGNGPDRKGVNQDYIITRLQSPHGCIDRRSIVSDANGVFFRSRLGLMRLDRGLTVNDVGAKISDTLADDDVIVDAAILPNYFNRAYFLVRNADSSDGKFLVYQWDIDQWAVDEVQGSEEGSLIPNAICWVDGVAYGSFVNESVIYEHSGIDDPYTIFVLQMTTQWMKFSGPQGFKRIRGFELFGEFVDDHDLRIDIQRDYNEQDVAQTVIWDSSTVTPLSVFNVENRYQFKVHIAEQRCESMRFSVLLTPTQPDSVHSEGATLVGMAFDVGIKPTMMRLFNSAQRG